MKTKKKVFVPKFTLILVVVSKVFRFSTNSRAVNTNLGVLGLDLHSSSPESVNFFGAQSSLGGHNFRLGGLKQSFGGARSRNAPAWRRVCVRAMLNSKKQYSGRARNKSGSKKKKSGGQCPLSDRDYYARTFMRGTFMRRQYCDGTFMRLDF